jgi:hypothetical protein
VDTGVNCRGSDRVGTLERTCSRAVGVPGATREWAGARVVGYG